MISLVEVKIQGRLLMWLIKKIKEKGKEMEERKEREKENFLFPFSLLTHLPATKHAPSGVEANFHQRTRCSHVVP